MANEKKVFLLSHPHGGGEIRFCWQNGSGSLLATSGLDKTVAVFNRKGVVTERIRLPGLCVGFSWDTPGDLLAIINASNSNLVIWDANSLKKDTVDLGLRDPLSCLMWAINTSILAVATTRGNLTIYNHMTNKRIPVLGKHNKKISCGVWSKDDILALGSEDKTVTINNNEGDTLRTLTLRAEPSQIMFSDMKLDERTGRDNTVSILVGKRTLFLWNLDDPDNPIELVFQQRYGSVVTYKWFGDGYILLGFTGGYFIAISTHVKEVGQELFQVVNHRDGLKDIALCQQLQLVASCGDNMVKIHDMNNLQDTANVITLDETSGIDKISWSSDGQLLAMGTSDGSIHVHLSTLPIVNDVNLMKIAVLSNINIVTIYEFNEDNSKPIINDVETVVEPEFIGIGRYHLALGLNNRVWFYDLTQLGSDDSGPLMIREKEYLSNVISIKLNSDYASVLYGMGNLQLHLIEVNEENEEKENKLFPDNTTHEEVKITSQLLTSNFLIYATDKGHIRYFSIGDWKFAAEFRHDCGVKQIYSDSSGTRLVLTDDNGNVYFYNPVVDECLFVSDCPSSLIGVVWDGNDRNTFVLYDNTFIFTYFYNKDSIYGRSITKVGVTKLPPKQIPLMLFNGELQLETSNGKITQLPLSTHHIPTNVLSNKNSKELMKCLKKQLALQRYHDAWNICELLNEDKYWVHLGESALVNLDMEWAVRAYGHMKDIGMVWSLESIADCEDKNSLNGHISVFLGEFDKAEEWYLKSGDPVLALNMRRDLLQWDRALQLAKKLSSHQIPFISKEYAIQLEFMGSYSEALSHFEKGVINIVSSPNHNYRSVPKETNQKHHNKICMAGIARNSIRVGDIQRGLKIAIQSDSLQDKLECGEILESRKAFNEAALLYEKAENWDKAAAMYIRLKNWTKVGELFPKIRCHKIHLQYAKAKEADGKYEEAAKAYRLAKDYDNLIRINLDYLKNPQEAASIVHKTNSLEGAKMVAAFFQKVNDFSSAIKFLIMSQCFDEAFQLSRRTGQLELFGEILKGHDRPADFRSLALHFEGERNSLLAGKYYFYAKEYGKALRHLMRVAKNNAEASEAIPLAIEVVGAANEDTLTNQLISYLLGETDGVPKDARYLFKLYKARGLYREAAKTAVIIANEEQINGSYRVAHDLLFSMYQELMKNDIKVPQEMYMNLALLHSYILARLHVKNSNHMTGARLLMRVANNVSKFPSHIVQILTSTVIECSRAGLKSSVFTYAAMLMRPEYRNQIDSKYSKKIEAIVRKPGRNSKTKSIDENEEQTPCPICDSPVAEYEFNCSKCMSSLPFCLATGRHIIKDDLTVCPHCDFPAIMSEFFTLLKSEETCPMCSEPVSPDNLVKVFDAQPYLKRYADDWKVDSPSSESQVSTAVKIRKSDFGEVTWSVSRGENYTDIYMWEM